MEYKNMPYSWVDYYEKAFRSVSDEFNLNLTKSDIEKSCEIMKSKNARVVYREIEYTPEKIFAAVTEHWRKKVNVADIIYSFYNGHKLETVIFDDTFFCLKQLKIKGVKIASLTDLPTAMPDELFKRDIASLLPYFDLYVSSQTCGFRKPNRHGLLQITKHFNVDVKKLVFVGDEEKDINTAKNAGCISALINRGIARDYGQDFTITSLREIVKFCG
ncbi:MAG: HAD-IA family hydrolase [Oscillospiraceae bacterium]|nr:HAD-IA family hydrolase [Oscillospiraceae bacterium]